MIKQELELAAADFVMLWKINKNVSNYTFVCILHLLKTNLTDIGLQDWVKCKILRKSVSKAISVLFSI